MNFFSSAPWNRGGPLPASNTYATSTREYGNTSNRRSSPSKSSEFSCDDAFPEIRFAEFATLSPLPYASLASTLVSRLQLNDFNVSAFANLYQRQSFPVPFKYESVEGCAAAVLVLATRANLAPRELTAEAVLTLLWILDLFHSQYGSNLSAVVRRYTDLLKPSRHEEASLRRTMLALQKNFLARLDWNIRLNRPGNTQELEMAFNTLTDTLGFAEACMHIENEAERLLELQNELALEELLESGAVDNDSADEGTPSVPSLQVPVRFSASSLLGPVRSVPAAAFPDASYVTPIMRRSRPRYSPFATSDLVRYAATDDDDEEEDYFLSDYEDFEDAEEKGEEEEEEEGGGYRLHNTAASALLLGKRKPWESKATDDEEQPLRKKLTGSTSSSAIFQAVRRSFLGALQRH